MRAQCVSRDVGRTHRNGPARAIVPRRHGPSSGELGCGCAPGEWSCARSCPRSDENPRTPADAGGWGGTKVLFVCTANVSRSPMAAAISTALAEEQRVPWRATSAGVKALVGEGISPRADAALQEIGVFSREHRARQVDSRMLQEADLVLTMTPNHADILRRLSPPNSDKVHTLVAFANGTIEGEGIPDPYGQSMTAHRASVRQLLSCLGEVVRRAGRKQ